MNYVVVEDEELSANRLVLMMERHFPDFCHRATLDSVSEAVNWFRGNPMPALAFFDIRLADGISFTIFDRVDVLCPVIFTTAYDEYAIRAFRVNSIDYLLKPLNEEDFIRAMNKYVHISHFRPITPDKLAEALKSLGSSFKNRFVVRVGEHIRMIETDSIALFFSYDKATYLKNAEGRDYAIDYSLEQLEQVLDPELFFRVSRGTIISIRYIKDIIAYSNSRLKLIPAVKQAEEIIVSRERVARFKRWLER